ncbi:MAG: M16 family metallopeptidase [Reyranellaceae bacterium]
MTARQKINRLHRVWLLLLVGLSPFIAQPLIVSPAAAIDIEEVISPSGIRAWLVRDETAPVISVEFAFQGGGALDPVGREGAARMMAALLDEGAGPYGSQEFHAEIEAIAARLSFNASADQISGSLRTLRDKRQRAFDLLRLSLSEPRFAEPDLERIRGQMLSNLRSASASPNWIAGRALAESLFAGHPYARPTEGTLESVAALGVGDVKAARERAFRRGGLTVAVVGDITREELAGLLETGFGALPAAAPPARVPDWAGAPPGRTIVVERAIPQSVVVLGRDGLKRDDPEWFSAFVMNYILGGGGFNSRLTEEIREKRGLAYGVGTSLQPYDAGGLYYGSVATANDRVAESIALIRSEMKRMAEQGVTDEELANAKTYLTGSFALNFASGGAIAGLLLQVQLDDLGIDYLDRRNGLIESVTKADVQKAANRLLDPDAFTFVVVGQPVGVKPTE